VIVLNETWLNKEFVDNFNLYNLNGFKFYHASRSNSNGGGVAMYVSERIMQVDSLSFIGNFEKISIKIKFNNEWIKIISYYRPPYSSNFNEFLTDLEFELDDVSQKKILCGDFNINVADNSRQTQEYQLILQSYDAMMLNDCVTRPSSNSVIDHVISLNINNKYSVSTVDASDLSDHNAIITTFSFVDNVCENQKVITKKFIDHKLLVKTFKLNDKQFSDLTNVNDKFSLLEMSITDAVTHCTTIKKFKVKRSCLISNWLSA
jgi:hypothetical protein